MRGDSLSCPDVLLSCQVKIPMTGLLNLMSANVGVDHNPDLEHNTMVVTADAYTELVLPRYPLHVVVVGFLTGCIEGATCYSVHAAL